MHSYRPRNGEPCPYECRPSCTLFPRTPEGRIVLPLPAQRHPRRHSRPMPHPNATRRGTRDAPRRLSRERPAPTGDPMHTSSSPSYLHESTVDRSNPLYTSHPTSIASTTLFPTSGSAESQAETLVSPNIPYPRVVNLILCLANSQKARTQIKIWAIASSDLSQREQNPQIPLGSVGRASASMRPKCK